ncbi:hypothetical protein T265_04763 [Opisthorchis viverrini]|uniref:Uncharacterized protein n=1 Tax=Opisthorchis viverrini TaxID=6198 RepID=A0A074ZLX9_OPIVI|nr:hypothetical protein T265_04763 [Opisthorchis viverrini]KER28378.1 hypothetical protein T265_04763 [Opisthorchis viverrini]
MSSQVEVTTTEIKKDSVTCHLSSMLPTLVHAGNRTAANKGRKRAADLTALLLTLNKIELTNEIAAQKPPSIRRNSLLESATHVLRLKFRHSEVGTENCARLRRWDALHMTQLPWLATLDAFFEGHHPKKKTVVAKVTELIGKLL